MKILFTGASSFTGFWFVRELIRAQHEVICSFTGQLEDYTGVRGLRVKKLSETTRCEFGLRQGTPEFRKLISNLKPLDLYGQHAAFMKDYRDVSFNYAEAITHDTLGLVENFASLEKAGCSALVFTGSVFEPGEGIGSENLRGVSPYGVAKGSIFQFFQFFAQRAGLRIGKFVIPNPFGAYEDFKFTAYLMNSWLSDEVAQVKTPLYVRDNIQVRLLAKLYADFCTRVVTGEGKQKFNPSQFVESQGDFVLRMQKEMQKRFGKECRVERLPQKDLSDPIIRINSDSYLKWVPEWDTSAEWDDVASYYQNHLGYYRNK